MPTSRDPVDVVRALGGHARSHDLLVHVTRHRLAAAVGAGLLVRAGRGVYALPGLPDADVAAARAHGAVSHTSAAQWWGLALVRAPAEVHVTVPHGARPRPEAGVRLHWSTQPLDSRADVTSPLRTVLDCATLLPFEEALAVADSALAHGLLSPEELLAAAASGSRTARHRRLRVAHSADRRAANAFESRLRGIVIAAGLTGFEPQLEIRTPAMIVHADLAHPELRIVIEADSFAHHGARRELARDCERYDELVADGWLVLRFAWEHVMFRPEWVREMVCAAVRRRRSFVTYGRHAERQRRVG